MDLNEIESSILINLIKENEIFINKLISIPVINEISFNENDVSLDIEDNSKTEFLDESKINKITINNKENSTKKIIKINLYENENSKDIDLFIKKLNDIIIQKKSFNLIEKVLLHDSFQNIFSKFRDSEVLIRACKKENIEAIKWLLNMNINPFVQDDNGMTALMHASENPKLLFVVQHMIFNYNKCIFITDKNNENALFHAVNSPDAFRALVNSDINLNHLNKDKDTVLMVCCRKDIMEPIKTLSYTAAIDPNIVDKDGNTGPMYLVKNGRYHEFQLLTGCNIDLDYRNPKNETLLSILIHCIYRPNEELEKGYIIPYIKIIMILVQMECNFNIAIDEEGNTPLMFFIMIEDIYTVHYIVTYCRDLDVSIKNKKGESAFSLSLKLRNKSLIEIIMNHKSFDFNYFDVNNNNLLMVYSLSNNMNIIKKLLNKNIGLLNQVNNKNENALIIATKLCNKDAVRVFIENNVNVNQQDYLGNTALYYAIEMNCKYIINALVYAHADMNLKNKEGKSALDLAKEVNNSEKLLNILYNPSPIKENNKLEKRSKSKTKLFSLKKIKKIGSKRSNSSSSVSSKSSKFNDNDDEDIEYITANRCKDIIDFSLNEEKNTYQPIGNADIINEIEMETYGYKDILKPETGVTKLVLRQALVLEALAVLLDVTISIF